MTVRFIPFRFGLAVLALILASTATACDPCGGMLGCRSGPELVIQGQMMGEFSEYVGAAQPDVEIEFHPTGGVPVSEPVLRGLTDEEGLFVLRAAAERAGVVIGTMRVSPPDRPSYEIPDMEIPTVEVRGDAFVLEPWVVNPHVTTTLEFFDRTTGAPLRNAKIEMRRIGGLLGTATTSGNTDVAGRFYLHVFPQGMGVMLTELRITPEDGRSPVVLRGFPVSTTHLYQERRVARVAVGAPLQGHGEIFYRPTGEYSSGIVVTGRQTSGIPLTQEQFSVVTDDRGRFHVELQTWEIGIAEIELEVQLPEPFGRQSLGRHVLRTWEAGTSGLLGIWSVGPQILYIGQLHADDASSLEGARVVARRTGGIRVRRSEVVAGIDETQRFALRFVPQEEGDLLVDLFLRSADGSEVRFASQVVMETFREDNGRFLGVWAAPGSR